MSSKFKVQSSKFNHLMFGVWFLDFTEGGTHGS